MNWTRRISRSFAVPAVAATVCLAGVVSADSGWDDSEWSSPGWTDQVSDCVAEELGVWGDVMEWPIEAIHAIHLPLPKQPQDVGDTVDQQQLGKILVFDWATEPPAHLWNPETGDLEALDPVGVALFCSGHALLSDGTPLVAGGFSTPDTYQFDYQDEQWVKVADMAFGRFYPTCTTLPTGDILVSSGRDEFWQFVGLPEIYVDEADEWVVLPDSAFMPFESLYPLMYLLPNGTIAAVGATDGPETETHVLDLETEEWTFLTENFFPAGSAAMYLPGKILSAGSPAFHTPPTNQASVIDLNVGVTPVVPEWEEVKPMHQARTNHDLTILADGTVLAVGGTNEFGHSVYEAELYIPSRKDWTPLASMHAPRNYHSTTILLGDGRVLAAGGSHPFTAQVFSPPYLFWGDRPEAKAPNVVQYDREFKIKTGPGEAEKIKRVALVGLGAVTHSNDMNQRYVPLKFDATGGSELTAIAPAKRNIAPPGVYMLFIISSEGVPSIAQYLRLE